LPEHVREPASAQETGGRVAQSSLGLFGLAGALDSLAWRGQLEEQLVEVDKRCGTAVEP